MMIIKPRYLGILRESALAHFWTALYLCLVMIALTSLSTSFLIGRLIPLGVVILNTKLVHELYPTQFNRLDLSVVDAFVVYSMAVSVSRSMVFHNLFRFLGFLSRKIFLLCLVKKSEKYYASLIGGYLCFLLAFLT